MITGDYILLNNQFIASELGSASANQGSVVYEVLRIIEGIPLFFDEHFERLTHSCELIGKTVGVNATEIFLQLVELSKKNRITEGNVMISVIFNADSTDLLIHFIQHSYPTENDYKNGVEVGVIDAERINPEAKVLQSGIREKANRVIAETGVYEVMLINSDFLIAEGSRSNLFFVKQNAIYTSPLYKVLKGVTLSKVLEIAMGESISVHFENVDLRKLASFDAMFITGTSPGVISVARVGKVNFSVSHPMILKISELYQKTVEANIAEKKGLIC